MTKRVIKLNLIAEVLQDYLSEAFHQPVKLTGSHFFGNWKSDSDYDFFTMDSVEIQWRLEALGFRKLDKRYNYNKVDELVRAVYRRDNVDIQLVTDMALKNQVQEMIFNNDMLRELSWKLSKSTRYLLWQGLLETLKEQM